MKPKLLFFFCITLNFLLMASLDLLINLATKSKSVPFYKMNDYNKATSDFFQDAMALLPVE